MDFNEISREDRFDMGNNLEHFGDAFRPLNTGSIFWVCVCCLDYRITHRWIFMKFSGYGHKNELAKLFHA